MRISRILRECAQETLVPVLEQAEEAFFQNTTGAGLWDTDELAAAFEEQDFTVKLQTIDQKEERLITERDIAAWFDTEKSRWGAFMNKNLEKDDFSAVEDALRLRIGNGPLLWTWKSTCLQAVM
jgi:hypothetical protein